MLNSLIRFSLQNRLFVVASAALLLVWGTWTAIKLPVDVLPDLNRPRVTIFLEAGGMSPEEIEAQAVLPLETALNGSPGVEVVRSSSSRGIGLVFVEFGWEVDVFRARQLVAEKLTTVPLPDGITPVMGPISSVMGQIMLVGLTAEPDSVTGQALSTASDLRTLADFSIRRRLLAIRGVSQVIPIGGDRLQYQVLVSSAKLKQYSLTLEDVDKALENANLNATGSFFNRYGSEVLISVLGRSKNLEDLQRTVVVNREGSPVLLSQVAEVRFGAALKRGDASVNAQAAVILTIEKQPGANTVTLTDEIEKALAELQPSLPPDVRINAQVFQQKNFIVHSLANVKEALRDGFILVVIVLFLFLLNFRTTLITLTAIPLSLVITALVFKWFGISVNTLTLGGLAIAIGELVDDAIVDVENVFRRLRENKTHDQPKNAFQVIFEASSEVRNSIVYATLIVVLVFLPLFQLQGIEGRIFAPLGIAYITSILASLVVSLTVTPALCSYLLPKSNLREGQESALVVWLKKQDLKLLHFGLGHSQLVIGAAVVLVIGAALMVTRFGTEFLPPFNEGSFTVNLYAPAGTSLEESNKIGTVAEKLIMRVPDVQYVARRTGRAELDEHVEPVSNSEIEVELHEDARPRTEVIADIRQQLDKLAGVSVSIGQPISHRLDHLLSGVRAQVAIKIFGEDLTELRALAGQIKATLDAVPGAVDVQVERQVLVPQLTIRLDRVALQRYGMQTGEVARDLEVLYGGKLISQMLDGQKSFDLVLRAIPEERENLESIRQTQIHTPDGTLIPLEAIAHIEYEKGINSISHENGQRRMVVSANIQGRDLGSTVAEIQQKIGAQVPMPQGYFLQYDGQFEAQKSASRLIAILMVFALLGIFLVLFAHFRSWRIVVQVMLNIPLALVGSVVAVWLTGGTFSVATLVGFITLTGIASRNGIMMISHYLHLMEHEGEQFSKQLIIRGSLERLVPVLMTALVAALALIPLTLDAQAAGKEILYPVATVILGGLLSSTLLDMIVTPTVFWAWGQPAVEEYFDKNSMKKIIIMPALLLLGWSASAQLSPDAAIAAARQNHPLMQAATFELQALQLAERASLNLPKPEVTLESPTGEFYALGFMQSFEFPTVYTRQKQVAKAQTALAETGRQLSENELRYTVRVLYLNAQVADEQARQWAQQDSLYQAIYAAASRQFAVGEIDFLQKTRAENEAGQVHLQRLAAAQRALLARQQLMQYTGLSEINGLFPLYPDSGFIGVPPIAYTNPQLAYSQQEVQLAQKQISLAQSQALPNFSIGYMNQGPQNTPLDYRIRASVGIPLWVGQYRATQQAAESQAQAAQSRAESQRQALDMQLQQAYAEAQISWEAVRYAQTEALPRSYTLIQTASRMREAGQIDYITFMRTLEEAYLIQRQYTEQLNALNLSQVQLRYLRGE